MTENSTGLILRTRPLTETSLIVQWLSPEHGRLSTVAKGARRAKSPFLGKLDLFYEAEFSFARSRRSELHTLREVSLKATHPGLRRDLKYLQQAAYGAQLIELATETETPLPAVHDLMRSLVGLLPQAPPRPRTVYAFELKLLQELGLFPDLEATRLGPKTRRLIESLVQANWAEIANLSPAAAEVKEMDQFLHGFLAYHLGKIPKSRSAAL